MGSFWRGILLRGYRLRHAGPEDDDDDGDEDMNVVDEMSFLEARGVPVRPED